MKNSSLIRVHEIIHKGQLLLAKFYYYVPVKLKLQHSPPPPWAFELLEKFRVNPPFPGQTAVQMSHHRSISGDQMPPPPGKIPDYQIAIFYINIFKDNIKWFLITSNTDKLV